MNKGKGGISAILIMIAVLLAINWLATERHTRLDLTDEKRFTLSNATRKLLKKIDEPVSVDVLLKGNYPSGFRKLGSAALDMLQEFKEVAGSKLNYRMVSPEEMAGESEIKWADSLSSMGFYPINLNAQIKEGQQQLFVYPVAIVKYGDRLLPVTLYQLHKVDQ